MYVTADEVYGATTLTSSEVTEANVNAFILAAEKDVDRFTFTTYWNVENSGTASSGGSTTLVDTGIGWVADAYIGNYVWVYGGTGSGQVREITDNTTDTLTVDRAWDDNPDNTSTYRIIYTATPPYYSTPSVDGTGIDTLFIEFYPLRILESLTINTTSVTTTNVYQYPEIGKLIISSDGETGTFDNSKPQLIDIDYWWGVYPLPEDVKRFVIVSAALKTLEAQMGGTHNLPSTYNLPEGSVTIGQAYVNVRGTYDVLKKEYDELKERLIRYPTLL